MPPPDEIRIRHLREAAEKAVAYAAGRSRMDLESDELLRLALTKLVEIVGEAAKQTTEAARVEWPTCPGPPRRECETGWYTTTSTSTSMFCGQP
jgi:uncharacterized protein with HEPN domain